MKFFSDLHIHSLYSRGTSTNMRITEIAKWSKIKGIKVVGTGDFTHSKWLEEIKKYLTQTENNLYVYNDINFILTTEVCNVYEKYGKIRKIHNIIFAKTIEMAEKINKRLSKYGNLESDGRPILSLDAKEMVKMLINEFHEILIVPAHIWTPWFSLFGANAGFDSIEECFEDEIENIYALETGLSSDPPMNYLWSALDNFTLISNSDAHSNIKIGREANLFDCNIDYDSIINDIKKKKVKTIEFFPEEGKYHWDGHRKCGVRIAPEEAIMNNNICPKCGRPVTVGVMHRVITLSDRKKPKKMEEEKYKHIIPLYEIISKELKAGVATEKVMNEYNKIVNETGSEFDALLYTPYDELEKITNKEIAKSIYNMRMGKVKIKPGYDGVFGEIEIIKEEEKKEVKQLSLF